jgi:septal ring factor EnvC (AmiA/AmiB activator)
MSGTGNGGGDDQDGSVLELVELRVAERLAAEAAGEPDPVHGWKQVTVGEVVTLKQLHEGLIAVSQISEAAIEEGIRIASDLKRMLPAVEQATTQFKELVAELKNVQSTLVIVRKDIQALKDDTRDLTEQVRLVPAIKAMLSDVLTRLP